MHSKNYAVLILLVIASGCTHTQLRINTSNQAMTVADVQTQQVLDNLAKFVDNPHALPHFSYPNAGASNVTDNVRGALGFSFNPFRLSSWNIGGDGSRTNAESYTMTPINDPRKLELMRCAYQQAISGCTCANMSGHCPDCMKRFNQFYLGRTDIVKTLARTADGKAISTVKEGIALVHFPDPDGSGKFEQLQSSGSYRVYVDRNQRNEKIYRLLEDAMDTSSGYVPAGTTVYKLVDKESIDEMAAADEIADSESFMKAFSGEFATGHSEVTEYRDSDVVPFALGSEDLYSDFVDNTLAENTARTGIVTPACLEAKCWFCSGPRRDAPLKKCGYVGSYCDTYVWVPSNGRDTLTKLTLTILDIALNDPPAGATSQVLAYVGKDGRTAATRETASFVITGSVAKGSAASGIVPGVVATALTKEERDAKKRLEANRADKFKTFKKIAADHVFDLYNSRRFEDLRPADSEKFIPPLASDDEIIEVAKLLQMLQENELTEGLNKLKRIGFDLLEAVHNLEAFETDTLDVLDSPTVPTTPSFPGGKSNILQLQQNLDFLGI